MAHNIKLNGFWRSFALGKWIIICLVLFVLLESAVYPKIALMIK